MEERAPQHDTLDGQCLAEDVLHALACGTLEPAERSIALAHLEECELCQALLADEVRGLPEFTSSDDVGVGTLIQVGTLLGGRYRVKRFVARGGMGEVYEAWDVLLSERVALKTINPVAASADQVRASARFKQEVQLSRRVADPHVCRIFEFGHHVVPGYGPLAYLTMEFIEGQTLGARLRKGPRLQLDEVVELSRQMLRGLSAAHAVGVLHRDLKSENVMLRSSSAAPGAASGSLQAVLMDFGLARLLADQAHLLTERHELVGSAAYMAPEQLEEGSVLSRATDVYSFGIVLFEMLTGRLPFDGKSAVAIAMRRLTQRAPAPSSVVPDLPAAWDELVLRCLERDVSKRFASTEEVAAALEALAHPSAVVAKRQPRRHRLLLAAAATAVAALAGAGLYAVLDVPPQAAASAVSGTSGAERHETRTLQPNTSAGAAPAALSEAREAAPKAMAPGAALPEGGLPGAAPPGAPESAAAKEAISAKEAIAAEAVARQAMASAPPGAPPAPATAPRAEQRRSAPAAGGKSSGASVSEQPAATPATAEPAAQPQRSAEDVRDLFFLDGPREAQNSNE